MSLRTICHRTFLSVTFQAVALLALVAALSTCGGSGSGIFVTTPTVTAVAVSTGGTVNVGQTEQLTATASYSDGSSKDVSSTATWTSSNTASATVAAGLVTGVTSGTVTITAALSGKSGSTTVTISISTATVTSVAVTSASTPDVAVGATLQLTATATYSDSSTQDVTSLATWSSSNTNFATVSSVGLVTGVAAGSPIITATFSGKSGTLTVTVNSAVVTLSSITVSPPPGLSAAVNVGATLQLTATANYSDGSTSNVTTSSTWSSSNTNQATVSTGGGLVTGVAAGSPSITAAFGGKSGSLTVTVSSLSVTGLAITAPSASFDAGTFLPLTAIATYSDSSTADVTNQVAWTSGNTALATVSTLGVIHGVATTSGVMVTGTFGGKTSSVTEAITKSSGAPLLTLFPTDAWSYLNSTLQMSATYNGTDVTTSTTWTSSNPAKASVNSAGLVSGLMSDGEVLITGSYSGSTASTLVTVSHAVLPNNTPIMDMTAGQTYMGYPGNLYENNSNSAPADHDADGISLGAQIQPLDLNGNPSATGAIAFISVGLSNTSLEFGGFVQYVADPTRSSQVNPKLAVLNGAKPGEAACAYADPVQTPEQTCTIPPYTSTDTQNQYDRIRDEVLATATGAPGVTAGCGTTTNPCLSEKQVQAVWLKEASPAPEGSGFSTLCNVTAAGCVNGATNTEAVHFEGQIGQIVRAMRVRYPNLKQVFLASRIYAGYIIIDKSPEVFAYEYGFSAKWAIQAQIDQTRGLGIDPVAGDLNYSDGTAAWIAWGPYMWANGANPRSDGLVWI
jgi:uncharacterized protein YjdB